MRTSGNVWTRAVVRTWVGLVAAMQQSASWRAVTARETVPASAKKRLRGNHEHYRFSIIRAHHSSLHRQLAVGMRVQHYPDHGGTGQGALVRRAKSVPTPG